MGDHIQRSLIEYLPSGYVLHEIVCDDNGVPCDFPLVYSNRAFKMLFPAQGKGGGDSFPKTEPPLNEVFKEAAISDTPIELECRSTADRRHFQVKAFRPGNDQLAAVFTDITDKKNLENQLKNAKGELTESEERFRALQQFFPTAIGLHESGHFIDANQALIDLSGFSLDEMRVHRNLELIAPESHALVRKNIAAGFDGAYEVTGMRKDGSRYPLELQGKNVPYKGRVMRVTEFRNIEERQRLDANRRQAQKMEAVGQLTGGIAHDFNNILNIVLGNLELLRSMVGDDEQAMARVERAHSGARRAAELTRKLLDFSRKEAYEVSLTSVNQFIEDLEGLIASSLTTTIAVETNLARDLWPVAVDVGDLENAILNLAINAHDAMPHGGTLTIETANKVLDDDYAQRNAAAKAGEFVMIAVSDTGRGMSKEVKERVLEPFFTTKEQGKGTGLGLSMVYGFVQRSGGQLKIYSEEGKGTTIRLYLPPATSKSSTSRAPITADEDLPCGNETVLVVEDEPALLEVAVAFLKSLGYKTHQAVDGGMAIELLEGKAKIDLLFSDVIIPGKMDGYQLAQAVRQTYPDLKILLASGFTKKRETTAHENKQLVADLTANLLSKPYNKAELAHAVRRILDR